MALVMTRAAVMAALDDVTAATRVFDELKVGLFTNDIVPNDDTVTADLTPCVVTGMAEQTGLETTTAFEDEDGQMVVEVLSAAFICTDVPDPEVIVYGIYCVGTVYAGLITVERFDTPVSISEIGDAVARRIRIPYPQV